MPKSAGRQNVVEPIEFLFNEKKALAATAVLISDAGGRIPYLRLIKLLYLADRLSIEKRGRPIIGGHYVSMDRGLVLSEVLDLIKYQIGEYWPHAIKKEGYIVCLRNEVDYGSLSKEENDLLLFISNKYKRFDRWQIVRIIHDLPEWKDPKGGSIPVTPEELLDKIGRTESEIENIREDAAETAHFDKFFGF